MFKTEFPELFLNTIICSYKNFRALKRKYPNKSIQVDESCPDRWFYYYNKLNIGRHYFAKTGELYDFCQGEIVAPFYVKTRFKVAPLE